MIEQILPCPFCGSSAHAGKFERSADYIFCDGCDATGSIKFWNNRHPKVSCTACFVLNTSDREEPMTKKRHTYTVKIDNLIPDWLLCDNPICCGMSMKKMYVVYGFMTTKITEPIWFCELCQKHKDRKP